MKTVLFALIIFINSAVVYAADIYWTSASATYFSNPLAWSTTGIPGTTCNCVPQNDDRIIFIAGAGQCYVESSTVVANITIMPGYAHEIMLTESELSINAGANAVSFGNVVISGYGTLLITTTTGNVTFAGTTVWPNVVINISGTSVSTFTATSLDGMPSVFHGNVDVDAPKILLNGATYFRASSFTKTTGTASSLFDDVSTGGNIFHGPVEILNRGYRAFTLANITGDTFNDDVTITINPSGGSCRIALASKAGTTTYFNGDIIINAVEKTNLNGTAITFGQSGGASILTDGHVIKEGVVGFTRGNFELNNFTQLGSTTQTLSLINEGSSSASALRFLVNNCVFNGSVEFAASTIRIGGSTFNGAQNKIRRTTGGGGDVTVGGVSNPNPENIWPGGNTFNGETHITNSTNATIVLAGSVGDTFGDVTFITTISNSRFRIADVGINHFRGNISFNYSSSAMFTNQLGFGGGEIRFTGEGVQSYTSNVSLPISDFTNVVIDKPSGYLQLNSPINVTTAMTFASGILRTNSSSPVHFLDNAVAIGANDNSHVSGPVTKKGDDAFEFPTGDGATLRPISISAPGVVTAKFSASYVNAPHNLGSVSTLPQIVSCEYWRLAKEDASTDDVFVSLTWNEATFCAGGLIVNPEYLHIVQWNGSAWIDQGGSAYSGDGTAGQLTSSAPVQNYGTFTLASMNGGGNTLPVEFSSVEVRLNRDSQAEIKWLTATEQNNDYFTVERSPDGKQFEDVTVVKGKGTSFLASGYSAIDRYPLPGNSYYRIRQTDYDGRNKFSEVVHLNNMTFSDSHPVIFPVPVRNVLSLVMPEESAEIQIMSIHGKIVYEGKYESAIDTQFWEPGAYLLKVNHKKYLRFIKI